MNFRVIVKFYKEYRTIKDQSTTSFFNEENWISILSLGIISVCFGIFGYLSQPKKDSN